MHRIGLTFGEDPEGGIAAFKETLRELGYVEGQNLVIEARDVLRATAGTNVAADLARMELELVVAHARRSALAARGANPAMPLVIITTPGLITNGFAKTIDHPGANATGTDELPPGVTARRLELLKMAAPAVSRVALLSTTPGRGGHELQLADAEEAGYVDRILKGANAGDLPIRYPSRYWLTLNNTAARKPGVELSTRADFQGRPSPAVSHPRSM